VLYEFERAVAPPAGGGAALEAVGLRDRAHVLLGGRVQGALLRGGAGAVNVSLPRGAPPGRVELLVESLGRVNYGFPPPLPFPLPLALLYARELRVSPPPTLSPTARPFGLIFNGSIQSHFQWLDSVSLSMARFSRGQMGPPDSKGVAGVRLAGAALEGAWRMTPLPLESEPLHGAPAARWQRGPAPRGAANVGPWLYRGVLHVAEVPADTWLCTPGASRKGFVWVNGFNLGVFWSRGPQRALFLPAPLVLPPPAPARSCAPASSGRTDTPRNFFF